jgi:hypothetical protein
MDRHFFLASELDFGPGLVSTGLDRSNASHRYAGRLAGCGPFAGRAKTLIFGVPVTKEIDIIPSKGAVRAVAAAIAASCRESRSMRETV